MTPPLIDGASSSGAQESDEAAAGGSPASEADPLVSNGLGSPLCERATVGTALSPVRRRDCETSGFAAAAAPTGNLGIDVHIDTGLLPLGPGGLLTTVQDLVITPVWMAIVWVVHALVVMLEWCFTIDLLDSGSVSLGLARGLRQMQATFTLPWTAAVLAAGAVICAYNGLVRRRVAESLGRAVLALAMMAGGSWVMLDPSGTVGVLGSWVNQASLGTLAATAQGRPLGGDRSLADGMGTIFATIVEVPWCYLEFGDVGWCRNSARLDPRLHAAANAIAGEEQSGIGCRPSAAGLLACAGAGSPAATALEHSARLLRAARTNGAVFLALPANGPARNAINDPTSLLRVICQSDQATNCRGPTAAQAEFRTSHGTWARVGGLLLIVAGVTGMLALLGYVALRLLTSALLSLLYLLLAPVVVLAPALGETGQLVFRKWAGRLFAAVVSKLFFSFLLGTILAVLAIMASLESLGWWTQWLLMSAFWWGAFVERHRALQLVTGQAREEHPGVRRHAVRQVGEVLDVRRKLLDRSESARRRRAKPAPELARERSGPQASRGDGATPGAAMTRPALSRSRTTVGADGGEPAERADRRPVAGTHRSDRSARLEHLGEERTRALAVGNGRRAVAMARRAARVEAETRAEPKAASESRRGSAAGAASVTGDSAAPGPSRSGRVRLERFLDAQAALPAGGGRAAEGTGRSYVALAGLAGHGSGEFERLDSRERSAARLQIDRELALRIQRAPLDIPRPDSRDGVPERRGRTSRVPSVSRPRRPDPATRSESSVMRDAREVAARRKRQLGSGRP